MIAQIPSISGTELAVGVVIFLALCTALVLLNKADTIFSGRFARKYEVDELRRRLNDQEQRLNVMQESISEHSEVHASKVLMKVEELLRRRR